MAVSSSTYRADVDGLRAVAVGAVLVFHAFPSILPGGFMGVDVFFVISGYLITGILARDAPLDVGEFYRRRIRRIFPALSFVLLCSLLAGWPLLLAHRFAETAREAAAGAAFVSNLYLWSQVDYFAIASSQRLLIHLWSLGVEEQFYLFWPLLIWGSRRFKFRLWPVIAVLSAASFGWNLHLSWTDETAAFYSPMTRLWELGTGGLLALHPPKFNGRNLLPLAGPVLILAAFLLFREQYHFPGLWVLAPVAGTALIIAGDSYSPVNRLLSLRPLVWIGLISYPLYLWHWPLLSFAALHNNLEPVSHAMRLLLLAAAFVLSVMTYFLIERPLRKGPALPLVAAMVAVLVASLAIVQARGVPTRPINMDERKALIAHYANFRSEEMSRYYRTECDFISWETYAWKPGIASTCVQPGAKGTYFLWGDSHAAALAYGLTAQLPGGYALAQVTTIGCKPWFPNGDPLDNDRECVRTNAFALNQIELLRPAVVFIAQRDMHEHRDWDVLGAALLRLGVKKVVLVGPVPQWKPSLPRVVVAHNWPLQTNYVASGLQPEPFRTDSILKKRQIQDADYVSIIERFCKSSGCLARVGNSLTAIDYGHLSPAGSMLIARHILDGSQVEAALPPE